MSEAKPGGREKTDEKGDISPSVCCAASSLVRGSQGRAEDEYEEMKIMLVGDGVPDVPLLKAPQKGDKILASCQMYRNLLLNMG